VESWILVLDVILLGVRDQESGVRVGQNLTPDRRLLTPMKNGQDKEKYDLGLLLSF